MKPAIAPALLATTSAHAAESTVNKNTTPPSVTLSGAIQLGDEWKFINVVRDLGKVTVRLNSQGGKIDLATKTGFEVRSWQMTTEVVDTCQSACALIWVAGVARRLPLETSLGFHQPHNQDGSASVEGITRIELIRRFCRKRYSPHSVSRAPSIDTRSKAQTPAILWLKIAQHCRNATVDGSESSCAR
jgi:hypothetical protein